MGLAVLGFSNQALAQCTPTLTPTGGETINCTGTTTDSIDGANAGNVIVNVTGGALMQAPVGHAIALGTNANINVTGNSVIQSYMDTIRAKGGSTVTVEYGSGVQAFTDAAIVYDGNAGETFTVNLAGGLYGANGTAVAFGQSAARLIVHGTAAPGGTFIAGAGTDDQFIAEGTGTFDANWIGSLLFGFDKYEKTGTGTWTLTGSTTAVTPWTISGGILNVSANNQLGDNAGALIFNGGTLQLGSTFNTARNVTLGAAGGTINTNSYGLTISSIISGTGSLTKTGTGNLLLSNANTYTGGTFISGGGLRLSSDDNLGATGTSITFTNGGSGYLQTISSGITSSRSIILNGTGTFRTNGLNSTLSGIISGVGDFIKEETGTLILTGANTYTGGTSIQNGILQVSANNNLGNNSGALTINGGTFQYGAAFTSTRSIALGASGGTINTNGFSPTIQGAISGTGNLIKAGNGTLTLTNTGNSYSGNTLLNAGYLNVGFAQQLGNGSDVIFNGGILQYNSSFDLAKNFVLNSNATLAHGAYNTTLSGVISGTGSFTKSGSGTVTLTGTNTYTGGTSIAGGTLVVSADSNLGAASGGMTLNNGILQYGAAFSSTRTISLGASGGTIDTNGYNPTVLGIISGPGSLTKTGTGALTLNNTNTYTGGTTISAGTLIGTTNSLQGNIANNAILTFSQSGNGTYSGIISGTGSVAKAGGGTVTLTGTNTYSGGTSINGGVIVASSDNNLGNTSGILTLNNGTLQYGAAFNSARNITLGASGGTFSSNVFSPELSGAISGTGSLTKTGFGVLALTGTNTYSGGTVVSGGELRVDSDASLGSGNVTLTNGGVLGRNSGTLTVTKDIALGAGGGALNANGFTMNMSGVISGANKLTLYSGAGVLTLSGANTYTGGTDVVNGIVSVSANNNLGASSGALTLDGSTLRYGAAHTITRNIVLGASGGTLDANGIYNNSVYNGTISGTGSLTFSNWGKIDLAETTVLNHTGGTTISGSTQLGALASALKNNVVNNGQILMGDGTLTANVSGSGEIHSFGGIMEFTGNNTYTGNTYMHGGQLTVGASSNLGAASNVLSLDNSILRYSAAFNNTRNITVEAGGGTINTNGFNSTLAGVISGSGALIKTGTGTLTLSGTNTYSGSTTVSAGTLAGNTASLQGAITNNASLVFDQAVAGTHGSIISGTGSVTKSGAGELTLSGTNTYSGGTTITDGVIIVSADENLGDVSGALTLDGGTLRYAASFDTARNLFLGAGGGTIDIGTYNSVWSGIISGTGSLIKLGTGTLTLTGSNSYTGGTIINTAQVIAASEDANLGNGGNIVFDGGTLQYGAAFDNARNLLLQAGGGTIDTNGFDTTLSGAASGAGGLIKTGSGTLTLTGASTYLGGTSVTDGILNVRAHNNLGDTSGVLTLDGGTLQYGAAFNSARNIALGTANGTIDTNGFNSTLSGAISGTGDLVKSGSGALTLSGANTSTGSTSVTGGTLRLNADNNIGSGDLTLDGGALAFNTAFNSARNITIGASDGAIDTNGFNVILSGILSGAGDFTKSGAGTLTLTGTNTYSGATDITAGKLVLNGSIANSEATIAHGAAIGGSGTTGNLVINGRAEPGNSIGTLNVSGDVTFNPGSVYDVEVSDTPNDSDKIIATGALIINGGNVSVRPSAGTYADVTHYTILQGASRTGMFTGVNSSFVFLDPTLSYTATTVGLTLTRNDNAFNIVAKDKVQQGVADAVENLGSGNDLYNAFVGLSDDQASKALDTLSGEHNTGLAASTMKSSAIIRNIVMSRVQNMARGGDTISRNLMALRPIDDNAPSVAEPGNFALMEPAAGGSALKAPSHNKGWWGEVFGSMGHSDRQGTAPGQNRESAGALFGMDTQLDDQIVIGAFGGWERGEIYTDSQAANTDVESWHGGLYGSYVPGNAWRFSGGASGSFHQMDTTRHVSFGSFDDTAKGETEGFTASAYAEAGYTIDYAPVALEPFIGLNVTHTYIGSYREKDGGAANLKVDSVSQTTPGHTIGIRAAKAVQVEDMTLNLRGKIGWDHNYGDLSAKSDMRFLAGNTSFTVNGTESARDSAVIGFGIDANLAPQTKLYVDYDGSYSADDVNHGMTLGVKIAF